MKSYSGSMVTYRGTFKKHDFIIEILDGYKFEILESGMYYVIRDFYIENYSPIWLIFNGDRIETIIPSEWKTNSNKETELILEKVNNTVETINFEFSKILLEKNTIETSILKERKIMIDKLDNLILRFLN
jgi:hypothetical protein